MLKVNHEAKAESRLKFRLGLSVLYIWRVSLKLAGIHL